MPRWDGFGRSLLFGALAAAGLPLAMGLAGPLLGAATALRLYLIGTAALYAVGLAGERTPRLAAAGLATLAGSALAALPLGLAGTAVGAAAIVAVCRSGLLWRQRRWRAVAIEALLGLLGLALARHLAGGGLVGLALGLWGYFLVQSGYFLIGGRSPRRPDATQDPFERARQRLERLLEDEPGPTAR